jgi:two-component system, chemotaxis family, response regulator PixG
MHRILLANRIYLGQYKFSQLEEHLSLLERIAVDYVNGQVQISSTSRIENLSIILQDSKIIYACIANNKMWKIVDSKLQALSRDSSQLNLNVYNQIKTVFKTAAKDKVVENPCYLAICWLVKEHYISYQEAEKLIEEIVLELIKSLQKMKEATYEFISQSLLNDMPKFCYIDITSLIKPTQQINSNSNSNFSFNLDNLINSVADSKSEPKNTFNFAIQIENILNTTVESKNIFTPLVDQKEKAQYFEEKQQKLEPIDKRLEKSQKELPRFSGKLLNLDNQNTSISQELIPNTAIKTKNTHSEEKSTKTYKIICVDDSPTILTTIKGFLDEQLFNVISVDEPLKALMQIIRHQPDIILLDISMPDLDGYELCSLLRKHRHFRDTPVVMVTGKSGFIDKARAKMVRASGYLTKPFSKADLLKVLFHQIGNITTDL